MVCFSAGFWSQSSADITSARFVHASCGEDITPGDGVAWSDGGRAGANLLQASRRGRVVGPRNEERAVLGNEGGGAEDGAVG